MKTGLLIAVLLVGLLRCGGVPANRMSCYKKAVRDRDCHNVASWGTEEVVIRPVSSLRNHYWEGNGCDVICYCNLYQLLCCPRDVFFGPKISFIIPCKSF